MNIKTIQGDLLKIVEAARFAPSVHNAQPWKVRSAGKTITVEIDSSHSLKYSDPTGRETIISLGIFCEAIILAASNLGWNCTRASSNRKSASLDFDYTGTRGAKSAEVDLLSLKSRHTDRSIYTPVRLSSRAVKKISTSFGPKGAAIKVISDRIKIEEIARLTSQGISLALSSPDFRKELSRYLTYPWLSNRGISVLSLHLPLPLALLEPLLIRWGWGLKAEARMERKRWESASGVIFILTSGDMDKDWFAAGRAYLRVSLAVEQLGLAQATSAATVEASTFHEDIEDLLATKQRLQCVLRIGKSGSKKVYSRRAKAADLLAT